MEYMEARMQDRYDAFDEMQREAAERDRSIEAVYTAAKDIEVSITGYSWGDGMVFGDANSIEQTQAAFHALHSVPELKAEIRKLRAQTHKEQS